MQVCKKCCGLGFFPLTLIPFICTECKGTGRVPGIVNKWLILDQIESLKQIQQIDNGMLMMPITIVDNLPEQVRTMLCNWNVQKENQDTVKKHKEQT